MFVCLFVCNIFFKVFKKKQHFNAAYLQTMVKMFPTQRNSPPQTKKDIVNSNAGLDIFSFVIYTFAIMLGRKFQFRRQTNLQSLKQNKQKELYKYHYKYPKFRTSNIAQFAHFIFKLHNLDTDTRFVIESLQRTILKKFKINLISFLFLFS